MITKLLTFILTFILAVINLMVSMLPLELLITPFAYLFPKLVDKISIDIIILSLFFVMSYILIYIAMDWLFSMTVRHFTKRTTPIHKAKSVVDHKEIEESFLWLKKKFNLKNVNLYISGENVVNAYAVGGFRRKAVILTMGLINQAHNKTDDRKQALEAIRGIIGHELSHLSNQDYLPALLTFANQKALGFIDRIIFLIFKSISIFFMIIPVIGNPLSYLFNMIYSGINMFIDGVNLFFFMPLYRLLQKALSRSIEFRCDRDSALAFGGRRIAIGLSMLGAGSYFSVFSTHPRTKTRINKVEKVKAISGYIRPGFLTQIINVLSVLSVCYLWYLIAEIAAFRYL